MLVGVMEAVVVVVVVVVRVTMLVAVMDVGVVGVAAVVVFVHGRARWLCHLPGVVVVESWG